MVAKTRLGEAGYGVKRAGDFSGKTAGTPSFPHPVGVITRLALDGYGVRRYGTFAGKTQSAQPAAPVVGTVGGTRHHGERRYSSSYGFNKKRWLELLEEIRLEQVAEATPTKAKTAVQVVATASRVAAEVATELSDLADAQQLASLLVAAERASKAVDAIRQANAALAFARALQARIDDEDDDDIMLMVWAL